MCQESPILLMKKKKINALAHPIVKLYETLMIKTVFSWFKQRQIDQWNRIESSETGHWIYSRGCTAVLWEKGRLSINTLG